MTRQEAVEYDNELKCKMEQVAEEYSLMALRIFNENIVK